MPNNKGMKVDSPVGEVSLDATGSPVAVTRMDASQACAGIPGLLKEHINNRDTQAWKQLETRIDYMYASLDHALGALEGETRLGDKITHERWAEAVLQTQSGQSGEHRRVPGGLGVQGWGSTPWVITIYSPVRSCWSKSTKVLSRQRDQSIEEKEVF